MKPGLRRRVSDGVRGLNAIRLGEIAAISGRTSSSGGVGVPMTMIRPGSARQGSVLASSRESRKSPLRGRPGTLRTGDSRASTDLEERKKAFSVLQRQVLEQALSVPLLFQFELDAHNTKVKGFKPNLLGKPRFDGVWFDG